MDQKNQEKYYYYSQQLRKYENLKKRVGTSYTTEYYIDKYQGLIDELTQLPTKKNPELREVKKCSDEEWAGIMKDKIAKLRRKIRSGKATGIDHMLYDLYRGKNLHEKKYFEFE